MRRVRLVLHRVRAHVYFTHNDEPFLLSLAHFEMVPVMLFASKLARAPRRRVCHTRRVRLMLRRVRAHADFTHNDEAFLLSLAHVEVVPPTQLTDCWVSTRHAALHACASAPHYALFLRCRRHWLTPKMGPPPKWTQPSPPPISTAPSGVRQNAGRRHSFSIFGSRVSAFMARACGGFYLLGTLRIVVVVVVSDGSL